MRNIYIVCSFLVFSFSLCYQYYQDYQDPPPAQVLDTYQNNTHLLGENTSSNNVTKTNWQLPNETKLKEMREYTTQYKVNKSFEELQEEYYQAEPKALEHLTFYYAKHSNFWECIKDCPAKIDIENLNMFYASLMEIKYLNQELFTDKMNEMVSIIENYRNI